MGHNGDKTCKVFFVLMLDIVERQRRQTTWAGLTIVPFMPWHRAPCMGPPAAGPSGIPVLKLKISPA